MINFNISGIDGGILTLERVAGKPLQLNIGDLVKAEVVGLLPGGGAKLKIDGSIVTAKTELVLQKDAVIFLKVADDGQAGNGLKLQFAGYAAQPEGIGATNNLRESALGQTINQLTKELSSNSLTGNALTDSILKDAGRGPVSLKTLDALLKALPDNINTLPREVRLQLQGLLQASLKTTGLGIQARVGDFLGRQIPDMLKGHPLIETLKTDLMVTMDKLLTVSLKNVLQDTGVALESKLRNIAELLIKADHTQNSLKPNTGDKGPQAAQGKETIVSDSRQNAGAHDKIAVQTDLKAGLLQLKQILIDEGGELSRNLSGLSAAPNKIENAVKVIDQFLKDIETFQALSKTTDSFYTFLPVNWKDLKNGDIVFKRMRKDDPVSPYSCRINLDLERFGELVIMVTMYKRDFFVSLKAANPDFQSTLAANSDKLQDTFREKGLNLMAVNVTDINDSSMEQADTFETSDKIISIKA